MCRTKRKKGQQQQRTTVRHQPKQNVLFIYIFAWINVCTCCAFLIFLLFCIHRILLPFLHFCSGDKVQYYVGFCAFGFKILPTKATVLHKFSVIQSFARSMKKPIKIISIGMSVWRFVGWNEYEQAGPVTRTNARNRYFLPRKWVFSLANRTSQIMKMRNISRDFGLWFGVFFLQPLILFAWAIVHFFSPWISFNFIEYFCRMLR